MKIIYGIEISCAFHTNQYVTYRQRITPFTILRIWLKVNRKTKWLSVSQDKIQIKNSSEKKTCMRKGFVEKQNAQRIYNSQSYIGIHPQLPSILTERIPKYTPICSILNWFYICIVSA